MKIKVNPSKDGQSVELDLEKGKCLVLTFFQADKLRKLIQSAICLGLSSGVNDGGWNEKIKHIECYEKRKSKDKTELDRDA